MEINDYGGAIESFGHARAQLRDNTSGSLSVISLVSVLTVYCSVTEPLNL